MNVKFEKHDFLHTNIYFLEQIVDKEFDPWKRQWNDCEHQHSQGTPGTFEILLQVCISLFQTHGTGFVFIYASTFCKSVDVIMIEQRSLLNSNLFITYKIPKSLLTKNGLKI